MKREGEREMEKGSRSGIHCKMLIGILALACKMNLTTVLFLNDGPPILPLVNSTFDLYVHN